MRKATQEELMLGLEPEKYTKKPWNPYDFIGQDRIVKIPNPPPSRADILNAEVDSEIEEMYKKNAKPWDIRDVKNPQLYQDFIEAVRANPEMEESLNRNYNDALNATWEDEDGGEIVPANVQNGLFKDWMNEDIEKNKAKLFMQRLIK